MGKLDLSAYDKIIGDYYPCCICGKPGVQWFGKGASGCADHLVEAEAKARSDHERHTDLLNAAIARGQFVIK